MAADHDDQVVMPGRGCDPHRQGRHRRWRTALGWHKALRAKITSVKPDMVIASTSDRYTFVGAPNKRTAESERLWRQGLTRSLAAFRADAPRVVMLGDVFHWGKPAFGCMKEHPDDLSRCTRRQGLDLGALRPGTGQAAKQAAIDAHASFRPTSRSCAPTTRVHGWSIASWSRYDGSHLTATYSAKVWRAMDLLIPAT